MPRKPQEQKAANGAGSVRWTPSMDRIVGKITRDGKVVKRVLGTVGVKGPVEERRVRELLKPFLDLPENADPFVTMQTLMEAFAARKSVQPATRVRYKKAIKYLDRLGAMRLIDVKPPDIQRALDDLTGTREGATMNRTRQIAYDVISGVFTQAMKERKLTYNPVIAVDKPSYRRESDPVVFTNEEQGFMHAQARGTEFEAMLLLGLSMPVRSCELFGFFRADASIARREIEVKRDLIETKENGYVPTPGPLKTDESRRTLPLSDEVAAALSRRLEAQLAAGRTTPESLIFTMPDGGPIRHSNLTRRWFKPLLEAAAVEAEKAAHARGESDYRFPVSAGLYDLRHTAMENLKAAGVPLDVFHILCGHRSIATSLKHYNRPSAKRLRAAATAVSEWLKKEA